MSNRPGVFTTKIRVDVAEVRRGGEVTQTSDGRPIHDPLDTDGFTLTTTYSGTMSREDGRDSLLLEWVDQDGQGHRFRVPHQVINAIVIGRKRLVKASRSARATQAAATRAAEGFIPFISQPEHKGPEQKGDK